MNAPRPIGPASGFEAGLFQLPLSSTVVILLREGLGFIYRFKVSPQDGVGLYFDVVARERSTLQVCVDADHVIFAGALCGVRVMLGSKGVAAEILPKECCHGVIASSSFC